jgi:hypothetical protein
MSITNADTMKVSDHREEQLTSCLPGAWIVHGGNGPLFVRESTFAAKASKRGKTMARLRCW